MGYVEIDYSNINMNFIENFMYLYKLIIDLLIFNSCYDTLYPIGHDIRNIHFL